MNEITLPQEEFERLLTEAKQGGADAGRRTFIRQAAIAMYAQGMTVTEGSGATFSPRTIWLAAKALWDAKPEDC